MNTPFPYFGSKEVIASKIWERFGTVECYVEPFFGSGRVLFNCPYVPNNEIVNDANCWVSNFWRSVRKDPEKVAYYADYPVSEIDQHARGDWLYYREDVNEWCDKMLKDPEFCDPKSAGWWVWGMSSSIMGSFSRRKRGFKSKKQIQRSKPQIVGGRRGVCRYGLEGEEMIKYIESISTRLRYTSVMCGDWTRVVEESTFKSFKTTAIFFDPPYGAKGQFGKAYGKEDSNIIARDVMYWCKMKEDRKDLRIAVCGYEGEHNKLTSWTKLNWSTNGGMNNTSKSKEVLNKDREIVLFSPSCLSEPSLYDLFSSLEDVCH